jgi:hypothetical protein
MMGEQMKTPLIADGCAKKTEVLKRLEKMCTISLAEFGKIGETARGSERICERSAPVQGKLVGIIDITICLLPKKDEGSARDLEVLEEIEKKLLDLLAGRRHGLAFDDNLFSGRTSLLVIEREGEFADKLI